MEDRMAMLTKGIWIVVADSERAMVLENVGDTRAPELHQIHRLEAVEVAVASDRPGRMNDNGPGQKSAMEQPDFGRLSADGLAADLVAYLDKHATKGGFERLVLVAPPQVLGALRDRMEGPLRARISAELPKTLTGHPLPKIAELVAEALSKG